MVYGYIRVSTQEQNEERQKVALLAQGIPEQCLYIDKQSGQDFNRPAYQRLLKRLRKGDLLMVQSIDRLGRNYEEIIEQWKRITKGIGTDISIADMPLLDTRRERDLMGTFISDIVLQILSFVSQTERENIRQRQVQGIAAAQQRGVKFGRPRLPIPPAFEDICLQWEHGEISSRGAAKELGVSQGTFLTWIKRRNV